MLHINKILKTMLITVMAFSLSACGYRVDVSESSSHISLDALLSDSGPSVSDEETGLQNEENYFSKNGIPLKEEPTFLESMAVSYNRDNPDEQENVAITFEVISLSVESDTEKPDQKIVTLETKASMRAKYSAKDQKAWQVVFSNAVFDLYTGVALPCQDLEANSSYRGSAQIDYQGKRIELSYERENSWDWTLLEENDQILYCCTTTYKFRTPKEYDGLVFGAIARTEYLPDAEENITLTGDYRVTDLLQEEGYDLNRSAFFRFGQSAPVSKQQSEGIAS